jgi:hypothetical protein
VSDPLQLRNFNCAFRPQTLQKAIASLNSINSLVFVTKNHRVYCEVGTGFFYVNYVKFVFQLLTWLAGQYALICGGTACMSHLMLQVTQSGMTNILHSKS